VAVDPAPAGPFEPLLREALGCLCAALGQAGWEGECCLEAGELDWETVCDDADTPGRAWARLLNVYPTPRFPDQGGPADPSSDASEWAMTFELGAVMCLCPECGCEARDEQASTVLRMTRAALEAVACCTLGGACGELAVSGLEQIGVLGGAGGFAMQVVAPISICCPPDGILTPCA
jgi:hypothetical protein